jgi:hypothetical protein
MKDGDDLDCQACLSKLGLVLTDDIDDPLTKGS